MIRVEANTDAAGQVSGIEFGIPAFISADSAKIISTTIAENKANLEFFTTNGAASASRLTIKENGKVDIGTTPTTVYALEFFYWWWWRR